MGERVSSIMKPRLRIFLEKEKDGLETITGGVEYANDRLLGEEILMVSVLMKFSDRELLFNQGEISLIQLVSSEGLEIWEEILVYICKSSAYA